jgi:hypothetical protein
MNYYRVGCFNRGGRSCKGQMKIQQMAFVLMAIFIFFAIVGLFYFSVSTGSFRSDVEKIREQEAIESVRKISGTPEFAWTVYDCAACIDFDKILVLKEKASYKDFWKGVPYLKIERVYPRYESEECSRGVYPECNSITIIDSGRNTITHSSFVALCRYDSGNGFDRCELGKVIMGFETVE